MAMNEQVSEADKDVHPENHHSDKDKIANIHPLCESRTTELKKDSQNWNNRPQREMKPESSTIVLPKEIDDSHQIADEYSYSIRQQNPN